MNVYDHIAANNRRTFVILCAFPIALFVIVFLSFWVGLQFTPSRPGDVMGVALEFSLKFFPLIALVAFIWIAVSCFVGDDIILAMAHARAITFEENRELFRLVENTAIMAGLPTPKIYMINDVSMNAFATGNKPESASISLTTGIVDSLDKTELQAVIAHELAHIGNRDTRLMMITVVGIGCFIFLGEMILRIGRGAKKSGKGILIIFVLGTACLVFGYIVAPILRFALSRRREFQADATAVKIYRDPEALARALKKISENPRVEALDSSPLAGNMCIADPAKAGFISRLYATHPPIHDRITALGNMTGRIFEHPEEGPF